MNLASYTLHRKRDLLLLQEKQKTCASDHPKEEQGWRKNSIPEAQAHKFCLKLTRKTKMPYSHGKSSTALKAQTMYHWTRARIETPSVAQLCRDYQNLRIEFEH